MSERAYVWRNRVRGFGGAKRPGKAGGFGGPRAPELSEGVEKILFPRPPSGDQCRQALKKQVLFQFLFVSNRPSTLLSDIDESAFFDLVVKH